MLWLGSKEPAGMRWICRAVQGGLASPREMFRWGLCQMEPGWYGKSTVILGCGNWLCGDDGFGPAVAQRLERDFEIPPDVHVLNAGTSVREILFDIALSGRRPVQAQAAPAPQTRQSCGSLGSS